MVVLAFPRMAPSLRSTVTPGKLPTCCFAPVSWLKSVVLPLFWLPTSAKADLDRIAHGRVFYDLDVDTGYDPHIQKMLPQRAAAAHRQDAGSLPFFYLSECHVSASFCSFAGMRSAKADFMPAKKVG